MLSGKRALFLQVQITDKNLLFSHVMRIAEVILIDGETLSKENDSAVARP